MLGSPGTTATPFSQWGRRATLPGTAGLTPRCLLWLSPQCEGDDHPTFTQAH